jgi:hypothetical protein
MKTITSKVELLKKLKKDNVLSNGKICYLTDFHKTKCGKSLVIKLIEDRTLEEAKALGSWFEKEFRLRKPVGAHNGVDIFFDEQRNQFFFRVPKGVYDIDTYEYCVQKLDYLKNLGEKLK